MKTVGLTGGVGMGKSTSADLLRARNIPVVDTDALAHELAKPGQPALVEIQAAFGDDIIGPDGELRRGELARRVFSDTPARQRLEAILHPRICARWRAQVEAWADEGRSLGVVVIPLLFETRAQLELDATICVACSAGTQHQRLVARGWDSPQIQGRIAAQLPIEKKIAAADFLIWTETSLDVHAAQLDRILLYLRSGRPQP